MKRKDRAVSPVIATIILVAVAIVMSIAVAYWALGLGGTFARYEKLEIAAMYATAKPGCGWNITAKLKSTGSTAATVNLILLNGKPISVINAITSYVKVYVGDDVTNVKEEQDPETQPVVLEPGTAKYFVIFIKRDTPGFGSGASVEVTFHTAAGSDYPKVVILP